MLLASWWLLMGFVLLRSDAVHKAALVDLWRKHTFVSTIVVTIILTRWAFAEDDRDEGQKMRGCWAQSVHTACWRVGRKVTGRFTS
jgi:hypothetical protein